MLVLITFVLKAALAFYLSHLTTCQSPELKLGILARGEGDTTSYIHSMDNLIEQGDYFFWNGVRRVYAGRLPHYGTPYFILRIFFSKTTASDIYVLLQVLIDSIAAIVFALLCFNVLKNIFAFWAGCLFYFLNINLFSLTLTMLPESLSLSFIVFFFYTFHRYWSESNRNYAVLAGAFLAVVTVLKPYLVILYLPFFLCVLKKEQGTFSRSFQSVIVLSLPLILLLLPWIIRNAVVLGKFIPSQESFTAGYNYTEADFAFRRFAGAWGGDFIFWNPQSAGCYFQRTPPVKCTFTMPDYAIVEGYTMKDVEDLRQEYFRLQENFSPELDKEVAEKFDRLTNIYKSQKPFMYYIGSRVSIAKTLFLHTNSNNLSINPSFKCYQPYQMIFKILSFAVHILAVFVGAFGLIKLSYERKISLMFASVPLLIFLFFVSFKLTESRYFNHAFPVMLLGFVTVLSLAFNFTRDYFRNDKDTV